MKVISNVDNIIGIKTINVNVKTDKKIEKLFEKFNSLKIFNNIIKKKVNDKNSIIKKEKLLKKK